MSFFDRCKYLTVMVGDGSGVIYQPNAEYTYILTAKHNVEKQQKTVVLKYDGSELNIKKIYKHEVLDIAIIKIDKIKSEKIFLQSSLPQYLKKYKIYGYPETRRDKNKMDDKIWHYDLEITSTTSQKTYDIDVRNIDSSSYDEVIGFSGGGLFNTENTDENAEIYLAGIECRMNNEGDETHNRIGFISIKAFDEIVDKYKNKLVYLDKNRDEKRRENMLNNYLNFLVNRFDIRHDIEHFINSNHKKFLIKYDDDWDEPLDIILWLKEVYVNKGYNFIKFDLSENNIIDSLEDKISPTIEKFRKENQNQFREFDFKIIQKNKSNKNIIIEGMANFLTGILGKSKSTLEILKDDFLKLDKVIVILSINSLVENNAEKLYYEINEALDTHNIKLIIITNNKYDFKEIDVFKRVFLNKIKRKTIKRYLNTTDVKQLKVDSFCSKIDKDISHNDIKNEIIKYFNLTSSPIEGEKNAIR